MTPPDHMPGADRLDPSRRRLLALAVLAPAAAALLGACSSASGKTLTSKTARETVPTSEVASQVASAAAACDRLGGRLLSHYLKADSATTAMASPVSLALVMAILADGATDAAAQGYDALLGLSGVERDRAWSAIQSSLNRYDGDLKGFDPDQIPDKPLVHLANHVLIADEKDLEVKQSYLDEVLRWFSVEIEQIDVASMMKNLDAWASRNTAGLIPRSGLTITKNTRLVVQNALLFAAQWDSPFKAEDTSQEDFTLADGKTVRADLMHDTRSIPYATGQGWAAVRLAYASGQDNPDGSRKDSQLALDVVLPDAGTPPAAMEAGTWSAASAALDSADAREVRLALPKLDLTSEPKQLLDLLKEEGLDPEGLDKIAPNLALAQVVQQVRLILDEEGTVAAALTEGEVAVMAAPEPDRPVELTVDHPYVLRLRDLTSGTALVEAAVMDPTVKTIGASA
ncbi:serpin family protein [Actinomyces sp. ZJ308]|uniref:serpin family protein n=1 Tax=Actinomyces sp. ZJ308 TaxID=2708342 RepID=UPI001420B502|nr:serpin family protein [Actinomyces sp. ZJ308]